jgi:DNA invertase Pin-like site-specific DNA recombinase
MSRAYGYTRLSDTSQVSIANQRQHIEVYAEEHGLDLVDVLSDGEQSSGFDVDDLEAFDKLRERITVGDADAIIVNDKRRLVRDENEVMRLIADLRSNEVELHTHQSGQVDLEEPMQAAIEILRASSAAEEKRKEIERAKEAIREKQDAGHDLGRPRFGMTYSDDGTEQVPGEEFDTVLEILRWDRLGKTLREIEEETGVPKSTVANVLERREWYVQRDQRNSA